MKYGGENMKSMGVKISDEQKQAVKIKAIQAGITLSEYVGNLIKKDLETKKE